LPTRHVPLAGYRVNAGLSELEAIA